jgi:putative membrane protein
MDPESSGGGGEQGGEPGRGGSEQGQEPVDPRWLLANERTLLAWLRTGLALQAAGLAVSEFVAGPPRWVRGSISGVLIAMGVLVAVLGYRHTREVRQAMYSGKPIPDATLLTGVCMAVVAIGVILGAAVLIAL